VEHPPPRFQEELPTFPVTDYADPPETLHDGAREMARTIGETSAAANGPVRPPAQTKRKSEQSRKQRLVEERAARLERGGRANKQIFSQLAPLLNVCRYILSQCGHSTSLISPGYMRSATDVFGRLFS